MRISFKSCAAAAVLAALVSLSSALLAQDQAPALNRAVESSSRSSQKAYKAPAEMASATTPATEPPADAAPADTKVQAPTTPPAKVSDPDSKVDDAYTVGIADELQISVWKEPDLSGPVVVRPDGMITVPVIDDVAVVGLTTKQVQDILTEKLKPVVDAPQVTVIVRGIHSRKVYLVGQVGHPGSVQLSGHETVLEILAQSGGPNIYAKSDKIYILRNNAGREEKLSFNYKKALKGNDSKADFPLMNGDVIVVP